MNSNVAKPPMVKVLHRISLQRGFVFGAIIIVALFAFEIFNYSSTQFALTDLLGDLSFLGMSWATILALAFCGIDFAGIARLFTPGTDADGHNDSWYLFGAWLLAATMNAMLTWWGVSIAILNHQTLGNAMIDRATLLRVVPVFVAVLVWLIRVLIIGAFSSAGERLFSISEGRLPKAVPQGQVSRSAPLHTLSDPLSMPRATATSMKSAKSGVGSIAPPDKGHSRQEPGYAPVRMNASAAGQIYSEPASRTATSNPRS